jgi:hypothetical protein
MNNNGWVGVDLDGTLARYDKWRGADHIGEPIPKMIERVKYWLSQGEDIRIMTARAHPGNTDRGISIAAIKAWCIQHIGQELPVVWEKDYKMISLWDDRVVQVIPNTGIALQEYLEEISEKLALLSGGISQ